LQPIALAWCGKKKKVEIKFCILYSKFNTDSKPPCQAIISEFPIKYKEDRGLQEIITIDMVNCLRRSDEISFAVGVFVIIKCRERETWQFLKNKGHLVNRTGTFAMIFRPYHLLGVETATSVLSARHLKLSTGGINPTPRVDVGVRTSRTLQQGYRLALEHDHSIAGVMPEILPAKKMASDNPIPYYMAAGNSLKITVEEGRLLTYDMIDHDPKSCLWKLRREQDKLFGMPDRK
jgi:predicted homoserine dehydrogenase-like protein